MAKQARWFTADWHLNSLQTIAACHRPFANAADAAKQLIAAANSLAKEGSLLYHVGDFCLTSPDRHWQTADVPAAEPVASYAKQLAATAILIEGNHDRANGVSCAAKLAVIGLPMGLEDASVCHYPSSCSSYCGPKGSKKRIHVNVCGHVHGSWLAHYDFHSHVLNVNVGVDVWGCKPVSDIQIAELARFIFSSHICCHNSWWKTREQLGKLAADVKQKMQAAKAKRKAAKHKAKGLTLEECERRKQAAIAAKQAKHVSICSYASAAACDMANVQIDYGESDST